MFAFRVIAEFIDVESGQRKKVGDIVTASSPERAEVLKKARVIGAEIVGAEEVEIDVTAFGSTGTETITVLVPKPIKHVGGGYYELPDGRKIKGKDAALEALAESGDDNGAGTGDSAGS